ncbi:Odorant receptor 44, partial [Ephemera danica]
METDFILRTMRAVGMCVTNSVKPKFSKTGIVMLFMFVSIMEVLMIAGYLTAKSQSLYSKLMSIYHTFNFVVTIFRVVYFSTRRFHLHFIIELMEDFPVISNPCILFHRTFLIYLQSIDASIVDAANKPVKRYLISYMWWPTNIRKTPTYYFILTWQCFAALYATFIAAVSDAFTCSLMLAVSARAEMLTRTALRAIALSKPNVRLTAKFRYWLQRHQHYLKLVKMLQQINNLTSPLVFVSYLHSLVTCIIAAFIIMKDNNETLAMVAGTYALLGTIQLALLSHAGQNNARLSSCLLGTITNEVLSRGANRSSLQVLMARTSIIDDRFARISGFGFFTASLEFFSS